jgi:ribonuclease-3
MKKSFATNEKIKELLSVYKEQIENLEKKLGVSFKDRSFLLTACIHASFANENDLSVNNEKLEFLGDAVISLVISEYLFMNYEEATEGDLAKAKSYLASEKALASAAEEIGLESFLLLGKGASKEILGRQSNLADFFEAIIGAIYLDQGIRKAKKLIRKYLIENTSSFDIVVYDPKSALQEYLVRQFNVLPRYRVISSTGPAHAKKFVCGVYFKHRVLGLGEGKSKKEAEKKAALAALKNLGVYHE